MKPKAIRTGQGETCPPFPRDKARAPKAAAPPPRIADPNAISCEMLESDPTTSSGDGMAYAGSAPATISEMTKLAVTTAAPVLPARETHATRNILKTPTAQSRFPHVAIGRSPVTRGALPHNHTIP